MPKSKYLFSGLTTIGLSMLMLTLMFGQVLGAQAAKPMADPGEDMINIDPNGTANLQINAYCLQFGKTFPAGQSLQVADLADGKVRAALKYAAQKKYIDTDPTQVQLATWYLVDNTWHNASHTIAQEIVNNATTPLGAPSSQGTSLIDAVKANTVSVQINNLKALNSGDFFGTGSLTIKNNTAKTVQIYLPLGTTLTTSDPSFQSMTSFGTQVNQQGSDPTATPKPAMNTMPATGQGGSSNVSTSNSNAGILLILSGISASLLIGGFAFARRKSR